MKSEGRNKIPRCRLPVHGRPHNHLLWMLLVTAEKALVSLTLSICFTVLNSQGSDLITYLLWLAVNFFHWLILIFLWSLKNSVSCFLIWLPGSECPLGAQGVQCRERAFDPDIQKQTTDFGQKLLRNAAKTLRGSRSLTVHRHLDRFQ